MSLIQPPLTELTQPYWDGCNAGELRLQRCQSCRCYQFYPRSICSHCGTGDLDWVAVSGRGRVASFTIVRRAVSKAYTAPYVVALIDLEEGPRMMSHVLATEPTEVTIGAAVTVTFESWSEGLSLPVFHLDAIGGQ